MEGKLDAHSSAPVPVQVPGSLGHLAQVPELVSAWEAQVAARRAEATKIEHLLNYLDRRLTECAGETVVGRAEAQKAAVRDAAMVLGVSERTTTIMLNVAGVARSELPRTWEAFTQGWVDLPRVRKVAEAAPTSELTAALVQELDARASVEATHRGLGEFHRWLTRCVADLDPEAYEAACEEAGEGRYVRFEHQSNGMSYLEAYLPTLQAAAIQNRLRAAARGLDSPPAHDDENPHTGGDVSSGGDSRSLVQRQVDLLAAWLRDGRVYQAPVEAKIMVMIPEATLAGESDEPGVSADRSWRVPAGQARALASDPGADHQWYQGRVRRDERNADYDLLSARYVGRFPPARLRDALVFRDGTCQAPGCTVAAQCCDI
ncbi:DUF222 domain-containing protein, partial [Nesterenkonia haasae]|uniref:DUF222 domain-containing protein n=1 Tax=Nesterenkonia haasae TaxID=2587813 RepID=UPI0013915449